MKDTLLWRKYALKGIIVAIQRRVLHRPGNWRKWAGKEILNLDVCNEMIADAINSKKPFMAARMTGCEENSILAIEESYFKRNNEARIEHMRQEISKLSGMFSNDDANFHKFVEFYRDKLKEVDLLTVGFSRSEEFLLLKYAPQAQYTKMESLEPYYRDKEAWSSALKGKKVLVIHPFADTIQSQYARREKIWKREDILPEFELITLKAVQTLCGEQDERFETWFDALDYMINEVKQIDFDVALIGCGAYGLPLTAAVKEMGKQGIHLGGATQILFGIIGKRWEQSPFFKAFMNEYWVRPSEEEKPKHADRVEGGCYW